MTKFKAGDWVKVVKKAETLGTLWMPRMNDFLNTCFKIDKIYEDNICPAFADYQGGYVFLPESLEPVTPTDRIISALEDYRDNQPGKGSLKLKRDIQTETMIQTINDPAVGLERLYKLIHRAHTIIDNYDYEMSLVFHDAVIIFRSILIHGKVDKDLLVSGRQKYLTERMT